MHALILVACLLGTSDSAGSPVRGVWRAVLESPGGELPFTLHLHGPDATPPATVENGPEQIPFSSLSVEDRTVTLRFDWFDSEIVAELADDRRSMAGEWHKTIPGGQTRLPFTASRGDRRRFVTASSPDPKNASADIDGRWAVTFRDDSGEEPARAIFSTAGDRVTATFLTPVGDYRYLDGQFRGDRLLLSCFDGGHAFLFDARLTDDGHLAGDFWSRDSYHATWTARRIEEGEVDSLPDPWNLVQLTNAEGRFRFSYPDLDGNPLAHDDPRFAGKVVLVNLFGSWCPNCHDEANRLADWSRRYREEGLEVVGLAFEFSGDVERDARVVRAYAKRHGIDYPLLLAGLSDKKKAAEQLADIDRVVAWPTSIFIGRDGRVRRIHSGWSGPATGEVHQHLVSEIEELVEGLLAEPAPVPSRHGEPAR